MKQYKYTINGNKYEVSIGEINDNIVSVEVNGESYSVEMEKEEAAPTPTPVASAAAVQPVSKKTVASGRTAVKAPLPGVIRELKVAVGYSVKDGQTVLILEAMKMANNIDAETSGTIVDICVQPGETVMEGDELVIIE